MPEAKRVLVTGANGMIGNGVCQAFVRAGWTTYGLVRRQQALQSLAAEEIIPLLGSTSDLSFIDSLHAESKRLDVIVSVTEDLTDYASHYNEIVTLLRKLAKASNEAGVRPLVLFTSGCKDYGTTSLHGDPDLAPHTESSPLRPAAPIAARTTSSLKIFENADLFDAAILRPTTIYGRTGSYYGGFFGYAETVAARTEKRNRGGGGGDGGGDVLEYSAPRNSILHGTHVDDCAEAYVALAEHTPRAEVAGESFNISGRRYETLEQVATAVANEYNISGGVKFVSPREGDDPRMNDYLVNFPQWVGSEKIRRLCGWSDRRPLFSEGVRVYRMAYDALAAQGHESIARTREVEKLLAEDAKKLKEQK